MGLPRPLARFLVDHPPLARAATRATQAVILARVRTVGMAETATREDVLRSPAKRRMVAKLVYEKLVGNQESQRRIQNGKDHARRVEDRFPGGYKEIEPLVEEAARAPGDESPCLTTVLRIDKELQREHRRTR
jgi:hypothetical protein